MTTADDQPSKPLDPKEAMRAALEAKKAGQRQGQAHLSGGKGKGAPTAQAATKREFRRKSG